MPTVFLSHLRRYGPDSNFARISLAEARSYCRCLARESGLMPASWLLPRHLLPHFQSVLAYHRWTKGLGEVGSGKAMSLLRWWREELLALYAGRPRHPVMLALETTVRLFQIPLPPFRALLYAAEQDQLVKHYRTFTQLLEYCRHAAQPLGHLFLYLHECFNPRTAARADHICTGLQLAHCWQLVRRHWEQDRIYLPEEDRRRFGCTDADFHAHHATPALVTLLAFEVERTRDLLLRGLPLVDEVPGIVRPQVEMAVAACQALLDRIAAVGFDTWTRPVALRPWTHTRLMLGTLWQQWHQ
jgi:squalene synthase HpnC